MTIETLHYSAGGKTFAGVLASGEATVRRRPGVLVLHEGNGLSDHTRERAARLAALGYAAFAPDLFGEPFRDRAHGIAFVTGLATKPGALRERTTAALKTLAAQPNVDPGRLAAIGFCFGGLAALELARSGAALGCAVSFHGGLTAVEPAQPGGVRARLLVLTGADDPFITRDQRAAFEDEMTNAAADWQMTVYAGVRHGFTNRAAAAETTPGSAYHALADARSWQAMRNLFDETMGHVDT